MKKFFRMIIFSSLAIYLISFLIKGFIIKSDIYSFFLAALILSIVYYLITPILKIVLLPLNILTLGLASLIANLLIFNFFISRFQLIIIKPWHFSGFNYFGLTIPAIDLDYWPTLIIVVILYSTLINLFESIL